MTAAESGVLMTDLESPTESASPAAGGLKRTCSELLLLISGVG
jgi:hypothetical protein